MTDTAHTPAGTLVDIPPGELHDSPFQPRTIYTGIEGLAESLNADGLQQPLKVRLVDEQFELVFGHRRKRAAILAGLPTVPCLLVSMTDAQVRAAQMAENIQRDNMRALEEAEGYQAQLDTDGITSAELARRIGKSPSHVAARLRLLTLAPGPKTALRDGTISAEVAVLIARVGPPIVQQKALAAIASNHMRGDLEDGGRASLRKVRNLLAEKFTLDLAKALFEPENAALHPDAGACSTCPKRSGNALEFDDITHPDEGRDERGISRDWYTRCGPNLCTDPDCHAEKTKQHLARQAEALVADGKEVVSGNKARAAIDAHGNVKGAFIAASAVKGELAKVRKDIIKKGQLPPAPVTIINPRNGKEVQAYRVADIERAGVKAAEPKPKRSGFDYEAQRRKEEAEARLESAARRRLLDAVRAAAMARPRDRDELLAIVHHALNRSPHRGKQLLANLWGCANEAVLFESIDDMPDSDLAMLLLDVMLTEHVTVVDRWDAQQQPGALLDMAEHYGIDIAAARAEPPAPTEGGSTPSTAARAREKAAAAPGKKAGAVKYRCAATGDTWSGRGLQPAWLKAALTSGRTLAEFEVKNEARSAGKEVEDGAGDAGEGDTQTADLFSTAEA